MSTQQRNLMWPAITGVVIIFMTLLWTLTGAKAGAPPANNLSNTTAPASPATVAESPAPASTSEGKQEQDTPAQSDIQVESLTLKPGGFEPDELRRSADPFVLSINNRSRDFDLSFELYGEDGHKLHEIKGPKGQVHLMKMLDLPPGNYLLKEVNHPDWMCHIVLSR